MYHQGDGKIALAVGPDCRMVKSREFPNRSVTDLPNFNFLDAGPLSDGNLYLVCVRTHLPNPAMDRVAAYDFEMRIAGLDARVGRISFRAQSNVLMELYRGHVGYDVESDHQGHHYAERATRLLIPFIRRHGFREIWLTTNPDNWASRRTCERLGAVLVETVEVPETEEMYTRGEWVKCRYRLDIPV
jgi:predicted acetyltransferase